MSDLEPHRETRYGAEVELGGAIPNTPIVARIRASFDRRVVQGVEVIAENVGVSADEVLARLEQSDAYADLLEQTLRAIEVQAQRQHRQAIARVAARAWDGDEATIDRSVVVVDTIASLQPAHVRVLVAAAILNERAGCWASHIDRPASRQSPVHLEDIAAEAGSDFETVQGIAGQLVTRGLILVEIPHNYDGPGLGDHILTQLGTEVLAELKAAQDPIVVNTELSGD